MKCATAQEGERVPQQDFTGSGSDCPAASACPSARARVCPYPLLERGMVCAIEASRARTRADSWLGRQDSNLRMPIPKTGALPLGDAPAACAPYSVLWALAKGRLLAADCAQSAAHRLGLRHDIFDQLLAGGDVVDQRLALPARPDAAVDIAVLVHRFARPRTRPSGRAHRRRWWWGRAGSRRPSPRPRCAPRARCCAGCGRPARCRARCSRRSSASRSDGSAPPAWRRSGCPCSPRRRRARARRPGCARRPCRPLAIDRDIGQRVDRGGQQHDQADVVLARVAGAFEAVDADHVDALAHRRDRVAHAGALVDHLDPGFLEGGQVIGRRAAGGLDDLDPAFDDRLAVFVVGDRVDRRQQREVDAERLVGEAADLARSLPAAPAPLGNMCAVMKPSAPALATAATSSP